MKARISISLYWPGVLCGIGIVVPMLMPKIVIGPMSFYAGQPCGYFYCDVHIAEAGRSSLLGKRRWAFLTTPVIIALRAASHICLPCLGLC